MAERRCLRVSALTLVKCHCQLEENPVGNVEPMQLVVQYLIQAVIRLPSAGGLVAALRTFPFPRLISRIARRRQ